LPTERERPLLIRLACWNWRRRFFGSRTQRRSVRASTGEPQWEHRETKGTTEAMRLLHRYLQENAIIWYERRFFESGEGNELG